MTDWSIWFVLAFALLFVELVTGTFYVLMIALAAAAGGVVALLGAGGALQLVTAGIVGTAATLILRRSRFGQRAQGRDPSTDPEQSLDIGQTVHVAQWNEGTARVVYRGTQWDAVLAPGEAETTGNLYIREVRGTRLTLSAQRP